MKSVHAPVAGLSDLLVECAVSAWTTARETLSRVACGGLNPFSTRPHQYVVWYNNSWLGTILGTELCTKIKRNLFAKNEPSFVTIKCCDGSYRDATRTVQKSRKVLGDRGSGGRAPSGVQGQHSGGGPRGRRPLEARAFSQSELPRKPPIDTHGRYTYTTCTEEEKKKKKSRNVRKSRNSDKSRKTASLLIGIILGEIICESSNWPHIQRLKITILGANWQLFRLERSAKCSYFILSTQNIIKFYWFVMKINIYCIIKLATEICSFPLGNKYFGVFVLNGLTLIPLGYFEDLSPLGGGGCFGPPPPLRSWQLMDRLTWKLAQS